MSAQTSITWSSIDAQMHPELHEERSEKILQMVLANKTDGQPTPMSDTETIREFVDLEAAQEYADFISAMDVKYGPGLVLNIQVSLTSNAT